MNKVVKNILLLSACWFLIACGQSKPSQEVLAAINHIEKNSIMPRQGFGDLNTVTSTDPRLEKSDYLRLYYLQDNSKGRRVQAIYVRYSRADIDVWNALPDTFKLKNYDNVYYVSQGTPLTYIRKAGCTIVTQYYDLNTKKLSQYTQDVIFTGKEKSNGICNSADTISHKTLPKSNF